MKNYDFVDDNKSFCIDDEVKMILTSSDKEHINRFPENHSNLMDYTVMVFKETYVPEPLIEEFQLSYEGIIRKKR